MPTSPLTQDLIDEIIGIGRQAAGVGLGDIALANLDLRLFVMRIVGQLLTLVGIIFIGLLVWAGALWMTSGGAEEQVSKAMKILKRSAVGVIIIMLSLSGVRFVARSVTKAVTADMRKQVQACATGSGVQMCCAEWQTYQDASTDIPCLQQSGCVKAKYKTWQDCIEKKGAEICDSAPWLPGC